jgi:hypothetical protein
MELMELRKITGAITYVVEVNFDFGIKSGMPRPAMQEYEIRIFQAENFAAVTTFEIQLHDKAAIRSARKTAAGKPFEVRRGSEIICGWTTGPSARPGIHL